MDPADSRRITRVPRYSGYRYASPCFVYGAVTRYGQTFQTVPLARLLQHRGPTTPLRPEPQRFGLCPVRSPLLGVSLLFSLPQGTKMFQFPWFASAYADDRSSTGRVVPFGDPRIKGHLHLPAAYRSLSRPSSPVRAKASAMCPSFTFAIMTGILYHMPTTVSYTVCRA